MGVDLARRRPVLPAPTDSVLTSADDTGLNTDVATDLSIKTNATHHTLRSDGTPITIKTKQKPSAMTKLQKSESQSQTSLLIEYFEGSGAHDPSERRPSVRVKVTPSKSSKDRTRSEGQVVVTETRGTRRPSVSRRIAVGTDSNSRVEDLGSISSLEEAREADRLGAPIEIEVLPNDGSEVSALSESPDARYIVPGSDISSMPPDSMLGVQRPGGVTTTSRSESSSHHDGLAGAAALGGAAAAAAITADKNTQNDRFPRKVIEKLSNRPRNNGTNRAVFNEQTRSGSSVSRDAEVLATRDRRRTGKLPEEGSMTSGTVSSMISSMPPGERASVDQRSTVSGNSNISVNNPKLLQAVEDAIKRLLPELQELRKDQRTTSRQVKQEKDLTPSDVSGSSFSREEEVVRHGSGDKARRRSSRGTDQVVTSGSRRRERQRRLNESPSERSSHRSESVESRSVEDPTAPKSRRTRDLAAGAIGGAALTAAALKSHESVSSAEDRERRRVGDRSRSSRTASFAESDEIFYKHAVPPMPLRSEVDSELTRSSLLSSHTNGTATPTHREVREVVRGSPRELSSATSPTPTDYRPPMDIKRGLGTHHGNFSEHDLPVRQERQLEDSEEEQYDDFDDSQLAGQPFETTRHHDDDFYADSERMKRYERNLHQQHPIRRGLSPIQSVASYTTTEPNRNSMHQTRSIDSISSLKKRQDLKDQVSMSSLSSAASADLIRNQNQRPRGINLETRSQILAQHEADAPNKTRDLAGEEFFEEQHNQNQHYREPYSSPGPRIGVPGLSNQGSEGSDEFHHDKVTAGRQVEQRAVANPEYVHTPIGVESAVASLCEPSVVDEQSVSDEAVTREMPATRSAQYNHYAPSQAYGSPLRAQISHSPHHSYHSEQSFDEVYHDSPHLPAPHSPPDSQRSRHSLEQNQFDPFRAAMSQSPHFNQHSQHSFDDSYQNTSHAPMIQSPQLHEHSRQSFDQSNHSSPRLPQTDDEVLMPKAGSPLKREVSMHSHEDVAQTDRLEDAHLPRTGEHPIYDSEKMSNDGTRDMTFSPPERQQFMHDRDEITNEGDHGIIHPAHVQQQKSYSQENILRINSRGVTSPLYEQLHSLQGNEEAIHTGHRGVMSPPHSIGSRSVSDIAHHNTGFVQPEIDTDVPIAKHEDVSPESEITTNPSVIHGPISAMHQNNRDSWTYDHTPPRTKAGLPFAGVAVAGALAGADLIPEPLSMNRDPGYDPGRDLYTSKQVMLTPPVAKDEGYVSGANPRSPNSYPRERKIPVNSIDNHDTVTNAMDMEDPFTSKKRDQYTSGLSDGMFGLYDNATGKAIDRIHSKDIVALMDHLTVRDAQRNARDTEILVTLVRTAAEMRNSFEDMKKFIAEQDDLIMDTADIQHEKTQKVVSDNKMQAASSARGIRVITSPEDDTPAKRKSAFKRMLNGLGTKNSKELQNIEAMLMQLLDEVETLRDLQTGVIQPHELRDASQNSIDNTRGVTDAGYQPEGQARTTLTGMHSNNSARQVDQRNLNLQSGTNRANTEQEYGDHDAQKTFYPSQPGNQGSSPLGPIRDGAAYAREVSEHYYTPEGNQGVQSQEYPQNLSQGDASGKKNKSFIPSFSKMVSRWSKTTASSGGDQYRSSAGVRFRPVSQSSQSDSEMGEYPYESQGGDRHRSNSSLQEGNYRNEENRPPSPLLPSAVSDNPKYQAHRNSLNLVHPQPRQGPTGRYQSHLESEAQNYPQTYQTPPDKEWAEKRKFDQGQYPNQNYPHGRQLSPISDGGYSDRQSNRSVSTVSDGSVHKSSRLASGSEPLVPSRVGKVMSPPGNRAATYLDHVAAARAGSPAFDKSPVNALRSSPGQARKPSGPRPLAQSASQGRNTGAEYGGPKKTRFRNSPNQIDSDEEVGRN